MLEFQNYKNFIRERAALMREYTTFAKKFFTLIFNRNTLITLGGLTGAIAIQSVDTDLYSLVKDFNISEYYFQLGTQVIPAYFILKGVVGNLREYGKHLTPRRILSKLDLDLENIVKMGFAGLSIHFAGEYFQSLSFGYDHPFFSLHTTPYWVFNLPGYTMGAKSIIGIVTEYINDKKLDKQ